MWSGAIIDIPAGYVLCDGTTGTPDLRDLFLIGAGATFDPGDSGGSPTHNHTFTGDGHFHTFGAGVAMQAGTDYNANTTTKPATGTTALDGELPPYYALAYIMKT